ncbi:hypothetical protein BDW59DRAFT_87691 [Aspergillus cavernicola]|uniref:Uncharacterized protein n=1 Tax=Aspergillus cavernicola TaxID=176166 RepID=A0ABR4IBM1_9EURO
MYYTGDLGPKIRFVYRATTLFQLAYSWFCVGATAGAVMLILRGSSRIESLFMSRRCILFLLGMEVGCRKWAPPMSKLRWLEW